MIAVSSRWKWIIITLIALLGLVSQLPTRAQAQTGDANVRYVATNGNDSGPGTIDQPWRTIQKAANTLQAGQTVLIRGGVYVIANKDEPIRLANSGTPDAYITYKAYPNEHVVIQGNYPTGDDYVWWGMSIDGLSYIHIEGLTIRGFHAGINCSAPGHHIVVRGNVFEYNSESGFSSTGKVTGDKEACDYLTVERNTIHHNGYYDNGQPATRRHEGWGSGISINPQNNPYKFDNDTSHFHIIISGNTIYHNYDGTGGVGGSLPVSTDGNGIIIDQGGPIPPILISTNLIFDNGGACIHPFGSQNVWIIGNTCYKNNFATNFQSPNTMAEIAAYGQTYPVQNVHIINNIAYARDSRQITYFPEVDPGALDIRNNLWFGQPFRETYSLYGQSYVRKDPLFVNGSLDPQTADFKLLASSPAIDKGSTDLPPGGANLVDVSYVPRPQNHLYDLGAYEFVGPVAPTRPTTVKVYVPSVDKHTG